MEIDLSNIKEEQKSIDFYPTPLYSFTPLILYLPRDRDIWEPACGDGRLVNIMNKYGLKAAGNDLQQGYNFLVDREPRECIVTNPPFSFAFEFAIRSLQLSDEVFLLLRLNFLASKKRKNWFQKNEPSCLFVLSERPSFVGGKTDMTDYAWFYWGNRHKGIIHL